MKKKKCRPLIQAGALAVAAAALLTGCRNYLVFSTATKFGLDISQRADQQPEVTFGYQRAEVASIPLSQTNKAVDASATHDAYSVLGTFFVGFDNSIIKSSNSPGIRVHQLFATGVAAQKLSTNEQFGKLLGEYAKRVIADPVPAGPSNGGAPTGGPATNLVPASPAPDKSLPTFRIPNI